MPGIAYEMINIGEEVIVYVDEVNNPRGYWKGELISCTKKGQFPYNYIEAEVKLTDLALKNSNDHYLNSYYNKSPTTNYTVFPASKSVLHFMNKYKAAEQEIKDVRNNLSIRINTLTDLIKSILGNDIETLKKKINNL